MKTQNCTHHYNVITIIISQTSCCGKHLSAQGLHFLLGNLPVLVGPRSKVGGASQAKSISRVQGHIASRQKHSECGAGSVTGINWAGSWRSDEDSLRFPTPHKASLGYCPGPSFPSGFTSDTVVPQMSNWISDFQSAASDRLQEAPICIKLSPLMTHI